MDIYWIQDGVRQGPLPPVEIVSMIEADALPRSTRAWHEGCAGWMPLDELPALAPYLEPRPSLTDHEPDDEIPGASAQVKVIVIPPPTLRFWAKLIDILMVMALSAMPILLWNIPFSLGYLLVVEMCPLLILYDALCLSLFGTTPGRALLNIRVLTANEQRIPFTLALARAVSVYIVGLGFMVSPFVLMMPFVSWWLTRRAGGLSPWDRQLGLVTVITARIPLWRMLTCAGVIVVLIQVVGACLLPWMHDITAMLPEWGRLFVPPEVTH